MDDDCSIISGSSGETEPGLPGPGRVLGLAYDAGGAALERFLLKILRKRKADGISQELASTNGDDLGDEWETRSLKMELVENQPGAGRTLDLAITAAGVRLERCIGKAAAKLGFGPDAVMERVWKQIPSYREGSGESLLVFTNTIPVNGNIFHSGLYSSYPVCTVS